MRENISIARIDDAYVMPSFRDTCEEAESVLPQVIKLGQGGRSTSALPGQIDSWGSALALRGYSSDPCSTGPPRGLRTIRTTGLAEAMPATWQFARDLACMWSIDPELLARVCLTAINPQEVSAQPGYEKPEQAKSGRAGLIDSPITQLVVPLVTSAEVETACWDTEGLVFRRHLGLGELWVVDPQCQRKDTNRGERPALHLVIEAPLTDRLRDAVAVSSVG